MIIKYLPSLIIVTSTHNLPLIFTFLPYSYDDPEILAGQGTVALEVIEQMDRLGEAIDAVVIPVGGGGLLAGMAATFKHLCPEIAVIVRFTKLLCFVALSCRCLDGCSTHSLGT